MQLGQHQLNVTENLDFFARQVVEGFLTGLHRSPYHGFSVEFAEHRLYNRGDSIKHIDWKLFARSDKLFIKKFQEETNLRAHLLIDVSSSMFYPKDSNNNKLYFSLYSAACLMYLFRKQRDGFGLTYFSNKIDFHSSAKSSKSHYNRLLTEIDYFLNNSKIELNKKTNFSKTISEFVEKINQRSLIIIFSDMLYFTESNLNKTLDSLQFLRFKKNEVILFHIQDFNTEKLFNFPNKPHNFIDLETNKEIKLNPLSFRDSYMDSYNNIQREIDMKCNQYGIDYVPAYIEEGFSKVLLSYLIKRSKLF